MTATLVVSLLLLGQANSAPNVGPASGSLVIDGGGEPPQTHERFVALAGGPEAEFVVIPTAIEDDDIDLEREKRSFARRFGVKNVTVLHTRDRAEADTRRVCRSAQDRSWGLVWGRPAMAAGRCLHGHANAARDRSRARPRRCDRRQFGRRDHPGIVPGSRCPRGQSHHDGQGI